ncbi:MAG: hypothetical protein HY835_01045 [Anaerolineae bacterium]|nr:hypothetical protein [Anaerolineae bacterium]
MTTTSASMLTCTQCGGELHPDEGQQFVTCPYCNATVYVDKSRVVLHWSIAPTLDAAKAQAALRRWMSGSQTVKDLDEKSQITGQAFRYFPLWYFRYKTNGQERTALEPAAATSVTEIARLNLPAGDLRPYDANLDADADAPSVPLEAGMAWFAEKFAGAQVQEISLVHVPVFIFKYLFQGQTYTAVVDASSATVLANIYPAKSELPYRTVGGVAAVVFLCLALMPVMGAIVNEESGLMVGLLICGGLGLIAAPILIAWAAWVAGKV